MSEECRCHVAVVNRTFAQRFFPDGDAIGHSLKMPGIEGNPATVLSPSNIGASWLQIIGIVGDARNDGLRNVPRPAVYVPYTFSMARKLAVRLYWMMRKGWDYEQLKKFGSYAGQPGNRHGVKSNTE